MTKENVRKSLVCIALAGIIFFTLATIALHSILISAKTFTNHSALILILAFAGVLLDWFPVFAGWMGEGKFPFNLRWRKIINAPLGILIHFIFGAIAYLCFIGWLFNATNPIPFLLFFICWFIAVYAATLQVFIMLKNKKGGK